MGSRRDRLRRAIDRTAERTAAARRVDTARAEITARELETAAAPYRTDLPIFYATALDLGHVPQPAPESALTGDTRLLPTVQPGSLLGLMGPITRPGDAA